jgi:hypothetical protein
MKEARHAAKLGSTGSIHKRRRQQREALAATLTSTAAIQRPAPRGSVCTSCGGPIEPGELALFTTPPPGGGRARLVSHTSGCSTPTAA